VDSKHTGDTSIEIGGKTYTLVYDWRALARIQTEHEGEDAGALIGKAQNGNVEVLASVLVAGLARHHPEMDADAVMDASPPLIPIVGAMAKALNRAYLGTDLPDEADEKPAKKRKATR